MRIPKIFIALALIVTGGLVFYSLSGQKLPSFPGFTPSKPAKVVAFISSQKVFGEFNTGLEDTLKKLGFDKGKNLDYTIIELASTDPQFDARIKEVLLSNPDVIVAFTGELVVPIYKAEVSLKKQVPFVAAVGFDLRDIGLTDFKGSKTFVAGVVGNTQEISRKRLSVAKQVLPNLKKVGIIANPKQPTYLGSIEPFKEAASALDLSAVEYKVNSQEELDSLLAAIKKGDVDLLMTSGQAIIVKNIDKIYNTATAKGIPTLDFRPNTPDKVLINYAHSYYSLGEAAAGLTDKIIKGKNPGSLPFEEPKKVAFTINLKIAEKLGISVPDAVLPQADKVIR